jgi:ATP synthase protein I
MREDSVHRQVTGAVSEGWVDGGAFLGSILSGTLLGWVADRIFGTDPWFVVTGIIVGSISGFYRMWLLLTRQDDVEKP